MTDIVTDRLIQPLSSVADIRPFLFAGDVGKKRAARAQLAEDAVR